MHSITAIVVLLSAVVAATPLESEVTAQKTGSAILQFEIDNDTFTSNTRIDVPGSLKFPQEGRKGPLTVIAAAVSTTKGIDNPQDVRCQAFNARNSKIGPEFKIGNPVDLAGGKKVAVFSITCR